MSKLKRRSMTDAVAPPPVTPSRDNVITLQPAEVPADETQPAPVEARPTGRRKGGIRDGYHASLYLPTEAQFALREIALAHRRRKPHDVLLEAVADLFERNGKIALAEECRARITPSRDSVTE